MLLKLKYENICIILLLRDHTISIYHRMFWISFFQGLNIKLEIYCVNDLQFHHVPYLIHQIYCQIWRVPITYYVGGLLLLHLTHLLTVPSPGHLHVPGSITYVCKTTLWAREWSPSSRARVTSMNSHLDDHLPSAKECNLYLKSLLDHWSVPNSRLYYTFCLERLKFG